MLRRGHWSFRASALVRGLATSSSSPSSETATTEGDGSSSGFFSSWLGKIKDSITRKASSPPATQPTLLTFADELKIASRAAQLKDFLKRQRNVNQESIRKDVEKLSTICRALGKHNLTGQNVDSKQKALAAEECGCTVQDVEKALTTFEAMKAFTTKVKHMQERGEKIPKTMEEVKNFVESMPGEHFGKGLPTERKVHQTTDVSRNAPCTCGSGKKFKRCCGQGK